MKPGVRKAAEARLAVDFRNDLRFEVGRSIGYDSFLYERIKLPLYYYEECPDSEKENSALPKTLKTQILIANIWAFELYDFPIILGDSP